MFLLLGRPLAAITSGLTNWLSGMSGTSVIILGIILGLMMCFDLGGPVNKAAYAFAAAGLNVADPASLRIMAAVMAAGMVPPLAMALATTVRPGAVHRAGAGERHAPPGFSALSFISEGAIPFAAADPLRVIPSMMFGGAITGALIMAFDVTQKAPHGGIFVFFAINPIAVVPGRAGGWHGCRCAGRHRRQAVHQPQGRGRSQRGFRRRLIQTPTHHSRRNAMPAKTVIVGSAIGLHARPAAIIAEAVVNAGVPVTLSMDGGEPVDAGSALMIMTLGAGNGAEVTVASDDEEALRTVAELVQQDLDA